MAKLQAGPDDCVDFSYQEFKLLLNKVVKHGGGPKELLLQYECSCDLLKEEQFAYIDRINDSDNYPLPIELHPERTEGVLRFYSTDREDPLKLSDGSEIIIRGASLVIQLKTGQTQGSITLGENGETQLTTENADG